MTKTAKRNQLNGEEPVWALGCMSGTSLDGVDIAAIRTNGKAILDFGATAFRAYSECERSRIRSALGEWPGGKGVEAAETVVQAAHFELIASFETPDVIGFHGQTLAHDPANWRTHQAGNGQVLADLAKCPVVWDFRSADMRADGQGAPLAPFYHFALARNAGLTKPIVFLNLGGVANLTWVDPTFDRPEAPGALAAFDAGPANAIIDDTVSYRTGLAFDENGRIALSGKVSDDAVGKFLSQPYFDRPPPKSLDRNHFDFMRKVLRQLTVEDAVATATYCVAQAVLRGLEFLPGNPSVIAVCGGGRKNKAVRKWIEDEFQGNVATVEHFGLDGDMLEAQAFAFLAVRVLRGLPTSAPSTTGCRRPIVGGRVSQPRTGIERGAANRNGSSVRKVLSLSRN